MRDILIQKVTLSYEKGGGELQYPEALEKLAECLDESHNSAKAFCWYVEHLAASDGELKVLGGTDFWIARLGFELRVLERALEDFLMNSRTGSDDGPGTNIPRRDSEPDFYKADALLREIFSTRPYPDAYSARTEGGGLTELPLSQGLARTFQELGDLSKDIEYIHEGQHSAEAISHVLMDIELMLGYKTLPRLAEMAPSIRHLWAMFKY